MVKAQLFEDFFGKKFGKDSVAQGTIEYLVVLAVIVVVSLVVVSLLINSTAPAQGVSNTSSQIVASSSPIAVMDAVVSEDGNYFLKIKNNTGENLTISSIQIGDEVANPNKSVFVNNEEAFLITSEMVCVNGELVVNEIKISYTTSNDLQKTQTYPVPLSFECTNYTPLTPYTDKDGVNYDRYGEIIGGIEETCEYPKFEFGGELVCCKNNSANQLFFAGVGTESNPYLICDWFQLNNVREDLTAVYSLVADLNEDNNGYSIYGANWAPIGPGVFQSSSFDGNFYGNNHKISNLVINGTQGYMGLFGYTWINSVIRDLTLENISVTNTGGGNAIAGGLAGYMYLTDANNITISGQIDGQGRVGGLAGYFRAKARNIVVNATVTTTGYSAGGIAGQMDSGPLENAVAYGSVLTTSSRVGGIVGILRGGDIINSHSFVTLSGTGSVGGIVGEVNANGKIYTSYFAGEIIPGSSTGGLIGTYLCTNVDNCVLSKSYWDNDLSTLPACGTAYSPTNVQCSSSFGKTTPEMKSESTFVDWDFINVWNINEGISYPYLR